MRQREVEKTLATLKELPPHAQKAIESLSSALINKLLHPPIAYLKNATRNGDGPDTNRVTTVRLMFGLDEEED
jgi:glutamyl-tRNA reductase